MQRGVHAHAGVAQIPIDGGMHGLADFEIEVAGGRRQMRDLAFRGIGVARIRDRDGVAGCRRQHTAVGGLAAGGGIEHGAVEHDAAGVGEPDHGGAAFLQI